MARLTEDLNLLLPEAVEEETLAARALRLYDEQAVAAVVSKAGFTEA